MGAEVKLAPGAYQIITGRRLTADQAADGVFPDDASVVLVKSEVLGRRQVRYTYLLDYVEVET